MPSVERRDEWERRLLGAATDCGVSLPYSALSSEGLTSSSFLPGRTALGEKFAPPGVSATPDPHMFASGPHSSSSGWPDDASRMREVTTV